MWLYAWLHYIHSRYHSIGSSGSLQHRSDRFDILHSINITSHCTRSSDKVSLQHTFSKSCLSRHFFFNRLPRLWNALPSIDINSPISSIRRKVKHFLWSNFVNNFNSDDPCSFHFCCPCNKCVQCFLLPHVHVYTFCNHSHSAAYSTCRLAFSLPLL